MFASAYCTRSTYHLIEVLVREIAYVWNPAESEVDELKMPPNETCCPFASAQCIVPKFLNGFCPWISMMSISPHEGQPTVLMLLPSIQNAGQIPCPSGASMRASTHVLMPNDCLPCVFIRADVYALPPKFSRRASITSIPFTIRAFSGRLV